MKHDDLADKYCSIARTWSVVGERWTMMILREAFRGSRKYDEFEAKLGLGRNILSDRLRILVDRGIMDRQLYQRRPDRYEYRLTDKGADLYPVLVSLMRWGDKHMVDEPPVRLIHEACGKPADPEMTCVSCQEPIGWGDVRTEFADGAW
jgi:DNA-binding HxlR family transcriptional regulator